MRNLIIGLLLLLLCALPALWAEESKDSAKSKDDKAAKEGEDEASTLVDGVIVVINEEVITVSELNQEILRIMHMMRNPEEADETVLRDGALRQLIDQKLLAQYAEKEKIEIDEKKIEEMVAERVKEYGGEANLVKAVFPLQALTREGLTLEDVKKEFRTQVKIHEIVQRKTTAGIFVTPQRMLEYYESHKGAWALPERARFREIEIIYLPKDSKYRPGNFREFENAEAAKKFAEDLLKQIKSGEKDFAKSATAVSMDPWHEEGGLRTRMDGGEWHTRGDLKDYMVKFLFDEKTVAGQVSGIIEGEKKANGEVSYFILKLEERQPAATLSYEKAQREIIDRIVAEERAKKHHELLAQIYKDAYIYPEKFGKFNE
jgi:hypothetical protein